MHFHREKTTTKIYKFSKIFPAFMVKNRFLFQNKNQQKIISKKTLANSGGSVFGSPLKQAWESRKSSTWQHSESCCATSRARVKEMF